MASASDLSPLTARYINDWGGEGNGNMVIRPLESTRNNPAAMARPVNPSDASMRASLSAQPPAVRVPGC
jgi:hypothetical protein